MVLTEMFATGFSLDPSADRRGTRAVRPARGCAEQAEEHDIWICGSVPEIEPAAGRPRNVLVLAGPGGETHRYAKIHPFSYAREHERYDAGTEHVVVEVDDVRVALFVCYDLRFADEFWALAERTDLYVVVANWPDSRRHHWRSLLVARAIENQAYVIGVNRVGEGGGLDYVGDSMVVDPLGEVLASAAGREATLVTEIDPAVVAATRDGSPSLLTGGLRPCWVSGLRPCWMSGLRPED